MAALSDKRITEIISRHRPKGIELRWKERLHFTGKRVLGLRPPFRPAHACGQANEIYCADPREFADDHDRRLALAIFLHECGHFRCSGHHDPKTPLHVVEFEATRWGHSTMRLEGIAIPREELRAAKIYVAWCVQQDRKRKRGRPKIKPHIARWSRK